MSRRVGWGTSLVCALSLGSVLGCQGAVVEPGTTSFAPGEDDDDPSDPRDAGLNAALAPTGLRASAQGQTTIDLSWSAPAKGSVTSYAVYVGGSLVGTVSKSPYQITKLSCGQSYEIEVEARSATGSGRATLSASTAACAGGGALDAGTPRDAGTITLPPTNGAFITGVCAYNGTRDFARISAMGVKAARMDRPSASTIESARTMGIEILPIADYGFTDLSGSSDPQMPPTPANYGAWSKRMVDTWRSMKVPPKVIEVWNEPWGVFWKPKPDPVAYLKLSQAFAAEAWAVWPTLIILISADESSAQYGTWRKDLIAADTDGFLKDPRVLPTTHNYAENRSPTTVTKSPCAWDVNRFQCAYNDFKAHGHPDPQVWITEFGWESNNPSPGYAQHPGITEQQQSDYHIQSLEIFRKSGMVASAYSYMVQTNQNWNYNWLRPDNSDKPVVSAIKSWLLANP